MKKATLILTSILLFSGCAKESNIYLNCNQNKGGMNFQLTIDRSKREFIFYSWRHIGGEIKTRYERPLSYTVYDDKLVSEKYKLELINGYEVYEIVTFYKINGNLQTELVGESLKTTYSCEVIEPFIE